MNQGYERSIDYKPTARDLTRVVENPSPETERTYREMLRWLNEGLPPAWRGKFLSSRF